MIRFRFKEDEQRYLSLLSEVYRTAASSLSHQQMSVVMRNLGKLQDILLLEGVRQGVSVASVGAVAVREGDGHFEDMKPLQLYGHIYGSHDTPLNEVEQVWLKEMGFSAEDIPWLDMKPMEFAPDTEKSVVQEEAPQTAQEKSRSAWDEWDATDVQHEVGELDDDIHVDEMLARSEESDAFESPQSLDRIRDVLLSMAKADDRPGSWQELVLALHRATHIDAGFIDLQLNTPMGRTVLEQAGMADVQPSPMGITTPRMSSEDAVVTPLSADEVRRRIQAQGDD